MAKAEISPQKITKPIQLLAAWLAGLSIIDGAFLTAAASISSPSWIPGFLCIAAVINVPLFLISLFILQTRFRPEMQEDTYYSKYLERKFSERTDNTFQEDLDDHFQNLTDKVLAQIPTTTTEEKESVSKILKESELDFHAKNFVQSRTLSELFLYRDSWNEIVDNWKKSNDFKDDISHLSIEGLIDFPDNDLMKINLTDIGKKVAEQLFSKELLWNQLYGRHLSD